jgi:hypothetical protein
MYGDVEGEAGKLVNAVWIGYEFFQSCARRNLWVQKSHAFIRKPIHRNRISRKEEPAPKPTSSKAHRLGGEVAPAG